MSKKNLFETKKTKIRRCFKEQKNEKTKEPKNDRTKERKRERTKERKREKTKERKDYVVEKISSDFKKVTNTDDRKKFSAYTFYIYIYIFSTYTSYSFSTRTIFLYSIYSTWCKNKFFFSCAFFSFF